MKTCPSCGRSVKGHHRTCVKCGAAMPEAKAKVEVEDAPRAAATEDDDDLAQDARSTHHTDPASPGRAAQLEATVSQRVRQELSKARYLRELVPTRVQVQEVLPHPTGWILGISLPIILALAVLHALVYPATADANGADADRTRATKAAAAKKSESQFKRCVAQARQDTDRRCGAITGTADGVRRMTCTVARLAAGYTRCTAKLGGRFGRCLARCGQRARACSSTCAGPADQSWTDTAKCLLPCWSRRLQSCVGTCFEPGVHPANDPIPSAL